MSLFWGSSTTKFDEDVDKATAETLPSGGEMIELNLEICDTIRSKGVPAKDAMRSIKRRVNHRNPNVQLLALTLVDTAVKNSGDHFLSEVASREFLDNLVSIIKTPVINQDVKQKILRLIQNWAIAFESKHTLGYAGEVYRLLQAEGFNFPPKDITATSAAMIDSMAPPEWIDSDVCLRCRTPFTFTNRKHHCRNCGRVFDQQCSSKVLPLPHLGLDQPVRVCDGCFVTANKPRIINGDAHKAHPHHRSSSTSKVTTSSHRRHKSAPEQADEDLQRAIQLSLEEAGMVHGPKRADYVSQTPSYEISEPPLIAGGSGAVGADESDPDLRAAIEASLREANAPKPSAPVVEDDPPYAHSPAEYKSSLELLPNFDLDDQESDAIMTFSQAVEVAQSRGMTDFVRHREVGDLYELTNSMRPKLARTLDDAGRREQMLSEMNQKLSQAARLYDQLLTAHVNPVSVQSPPAQQYYTAPPQQYVPPQPQQYATPPTSPPLSQLAQYNNYGLSVVPTYNPSTHMLESAPSAPTPQSYERQMSGPSTHTHTVTIQPQYYQAPPFVQVESHPASPPVQLEFPTTQPVLPPPAVPTVASPPPAPPILQSPPRRSDTVAAVQQPPPQPLSLTSFPSVPNEPLPLPLAPQHIEQQPQKEAMLISFD